MSTEEVLKERFAEFKSFMYNDIRNSLIDKSIPDDEIDKKTVAQVVFAQQYNFFMPRNSLRKFFHLKAKLDFGNQFIIKKLILKTRIQYLFYIIYIKLKQMKLRMRVRQNR
jgi:hypothetical protein